MAEYRRVKKKYTSAVTEPTPFTEAVQSGPRSETSGLGGYGMESGVDLENEVVDSVMSPDDREGRSHSDLGLRARVKEISTTVELFYNTMSCPCGTRAVGIDSGLVGCERNNFGVVDIINPISVYNHKINSSAPKISDKWRCVGVKCKKGDFEWDTLHVVSVVENTSNYNNSSLLNSVVSTSNCYIPKSETLTKSNEVFWTEDRVKKLYQNASENENTTGSGGELPNSGFNIQDTLGAVNGKPIFQTLEQAKWYNIVYNSSQNTVKYDNNGISGFVPGNSTGEEKIITAFEVNGKNIIESSVSGEIANDKPSVSNNPSISPNGGFLNIKIKGVNKPTFTLKVKDSTGCSVLKEKIKNVSSNSYNAKIEVPALLNGVISEVYTVELLPTADVKFEVEVGGALVIGTPKINIYQYKRPAFTFNNTASTITNAATTSNTTVFSGDAMSRVSSPRNFTAQSHVTTITRSSGSRNYYIKQPVNFDDLITKNNIIRKRIVENNGTELLIVPNPDGVLYNGDVLVGMKMTGKTVVTKEVIGVIDIDKNEDPCYDCDDDIYTNRFEIINSPNDIFQNMTVTGVDHNGNSFNTKLQSIDTNVAGFSCITLTNKHILKKNTILTFTYFAKTEVNGVRDTGNGQVISINPVLFPEKTDVTFENGDISYVKGQVRYSIVGKEEITITTTIDEVKFGREDVVFTLNVDDLVTDVPPIKDINLTIGKDTTRNINFAQGGSGITDNLTVTIVSGPKNGSIASRSKGGLLTYPTTQLLLGKIK